MLRMYEIFNRGGTATKKARLQGGQITREWYRPNPAPAGEVAWSIRNSVNYAVSGVLTALELTSTFPRMVVENFYEKSLNSIRAGETKPPYAYAIPASQKDRAQVDRVVNLLRRQAVEVHRTVRAATVGKDTIAAGSFLIKLNQPYGRLAKAPANTEEVGWARLAFDRWEIPFDLIHKDHVKTGANLRGKYDVIVVPHQTQSGRAIVYEQARLSKPLSYREERHVQDVRHVCGNR